MPLLGFVGAGAGLPVGFRIMTRRLSLTRAMAMIGMFRICTRFGMDVYMCICVWMPVCSSVVNEWLEPSVLAVAASLVFKHLEKPEHRLGKGHTKKQLSESLRRGPTPASRFLSFSFRVANPWRRHQVMP